MRCAAPPLVKRGAFAAGHVAIWSLPARLPADPAAPPALDDLIAALQAHLDGSRESARRLRQELSAAAQLLPRLC